MPVPFDSLAISARLLTNFAYDIIKNRAQASHNTLVGRLLHWSCFQGANFEERLREVLTSTWVIPVLLGDTIWQEAPFGKPQALPKNAVPILLWRNQDLAFDNVVRGIDKAIRA